MSRWPLRYMWPRGRRHLQHCLHRLRHQRAFKSRWHGTANDHLLYKCQAGDGSRTCSCRLHACATTIECATAFGRCGGRRSWRGAGRTGGETAVVLIFACRMSWKADKPTSGRRASLGSLPEDAVVGCSICLYGAWFWPFVVQPRPLLRRMRKRLALEFSSADEMR